MWVNRPAGRFPDPLLSNQERNANDDGRALPLVRNGWFGELAIPC
jgi:hypothetical protein